MYNFKFAGKIFNLQQHFSFACVTLLGHRSDWFNASSPTMETTGITINTTSGPFVFFFLAYLRPSTLAFMAFKVKR